MNFKLSKLQEYCKNHSSGQDKVLHELERETYIKTIAPQMISGHYQGLLLSLLSKMIKPKTILEIGTFTGYSAICLAEGLAEGGILHTIESQEEYKHFALKYFKKAGVLDKIKLYTGDAKLIIPTIKISFDIVFIDAAKVDYSEFYDSVFDKVNTGGYILADNVLWSGKVLQKEKDNDTKAIDDFNRKIKNDSRVEKIMLPIRDGIFLIRKK